MREYLREKLSVFDVSDFYPRQELGSAIRIFLWWSVPALLFVLWAENSRPEVRFYQDAIREGLGPNLWNVIGSFGFFLFGLSNTFPRSVFLSNAAKTVLLNTFAIGSLTFGLLVGQSLGVVVDSSVILWQKGLFGVTSVFLLFVLFFFNLSLWYLAFLIGNESGENSSFRNKLVSAHPFWGVSVGIVSILLITVMFLVQK